MTPPDNTSSSARAPTWRFLLAHPFHLIACGFGSGLSPVAPGTVGTLFAWASFRLLDAAMTASTLGIFLLASLVVGAIACERAGRALGVHDHGAIVWDEIVPFWLVLFLIPGGLLWQGAAFALFRLFDITKPWPASYFDREVKNGFGVMADDVVAAFFTLLTLAVVATIARFAGLPV